MMTFGQVHRHGLLAVTMVLCAFVGTAAQAHPQAGWRDRLQARLEALDTRQGRLGVFVRDLDSGISVSHRADQSWYLASMVKLPVAIAVLRGVSNGDYTLATPLTLRAADYVDGAGPTNLQSIGSQLTVGELIERMVIHSDNTASDMLIDFVGIGAVNDVVQTALPQGMGRITSLADVRRHVYAQLTPAATQLEGRDLLLLRQQRTDAERIELLGRLLQTPPHHFGHATLRSAYEAYYAMGLNSGRLDAYGLLLERLAEGRLLSAEHTSYLLDVMERVQTGPQRLKAGLPPTARFAHKTGTQRERVCDAGVVTPAGSQRRIVVVACVRGEASLARAERLLAAVGAALAESGLFLHGGDR
jgi:beta-lactamase class A